MKTPHRFVGIHIAGANSSKTSLVIIEEITPSDYIIKNIYPQLGPLGALTSDDRVEHLLTNSDLISFAVVDSPLSLPPCVRCTRPVCPGASHCEDTAIACLMKLNSEHKRKTACNPQAHRLWDLYQPHEISDYSSRSSLVTRAITLKRRLRSFDIEIHETIVADVLFLLDSNIPYRAYRNFENGFKNRKKYSKIFNKIISNMDDHSLIYQNIEVFHAFICSYMAILLMKNKTEEKPSFFPPEESFPLRPIL